MLKKRQKPLSNTSPMLNKETEDKSYKWYKYRCYCNLIVKSLLAFFIGLILSAILKVLLH